jgi:hypothetical protein
MNNKLSNVYLLLVTKTLVELSIRYWILSVINCSVLNKIVLEQMHVMCVWKTPCSQFMNIRSHYTHCCFFDCGLALDFAVQWQPYVFSSWLTVLSSACTLILLSVVDIWVQSGLFFSLMTCEARDWAERLWEDISCRNQCLSSHIKLKQCYKLNKRKEGWLIWYTDGPKMKWRHWCRGMWSWHKKKFNFSLGVYTPAFWAVE